MRMVLCSFYKNNTQDIFVPHCLKGHLLFNFACLVNLITPA